MNKNKNNFWLDFFLLFLFLIIGTFFFYRAINAAGPYDYTALEPIPGTANTGADLKLYIEAIYKFAIWTVGIAAVLMLTIGGFMYMVSAGNTSKMDTAKKIVTDAILGLIIALGAYLILYVINPDLVKITITMKSLGGGTVTESKPNPNTPLAPNSSGCSAIVSAAQAMKNQGCQYDQGKRNGCVGSPGYTDCSNFAGGAYAKASCRKPGNVARDFYSGGESVGEASSLKAGDVLATLTPNPHVVVCEGSGCSTVIHASGKKAGIKESNGSYYLNKSDIRVIRASRYCDSCGN
ncbi:MAG: pilin [Parcubacteria group bacterium]|jgi:hypothetical protein